MSRILTVPLTIAVMLRASDVFLENSTFETNSSLRGEASRPRAEAAGTTCMKKGMHNMISHKRRSTTLTTWRCVRHLMT
jgi:hypothetical protein